MSNEGVGGKIGHNSTQPLRVELVRTMDQLAQVFALQAICYMEENNFPYDHAFDGQ